MFPHRPMAIPLFQGPETSFVYSSPTPPLSPSLTSILLEGKQSKSVHLYNLVLGVQIKFANF